MSNIDRKDIYIYKKKNKGFTLIELIVSIVIIAILIGITIGGIAIWVNKARLHTDIQNANTINNILQETRMKGSLDAVRYTNNKSVYHIVFEWSKATGDLKKYYDSNGEFLGDANFTYYGAYSDIANGSKEQVFFDVLAELFPDGLPECKSGNIFRIVFSYYKGYDIEIDELTDVYCGLYSTCVTRRGDVPYSFADITGMKYHDRIIE